jgi:hypothetical protein
MPTARFLVGILSFVGLTPKVKFRLTNANLGVNQYQLVNTHFSKLSLLNLYEEGINRVISDIKVDIDALRLTINPVPSINTIKTFLLKKAEGLCSLYGNNYWIAIAIEQLANSNQFLNSL